MVVKLHSFSYILAVVKSCRRHPATGLKHRAVLNVLLKISSSDSTENRTAVFFTDEVDSDPADYDILIFYGNWNNNHRLGPGLFVQ
jgi:hypothetical protein